MTHQEFLATLTTCASQYQWRLDTGQLRAVAAPDTDDEGFCPILAVCWHQYQERYAMREWKAAAYRLDLEDPDEIVHAADDEMLGSDTEDALREALLTAVGLGEHHEHA
jgi:hypothetical protein